VTRVPRPGPQGLQALAARTQRAAWPVAARSDPESVSPAGVRRGDVLLHEGRAVTVTRVTAADDGWEIAWMGTVDDGVITGDGTLYRLRRAR
jgi:hypothetical protein